MHQTSEKRFVGDAVPRIRVPVEETVNKPFLEALSDILEQVNNRSSASLERLVVLIVNEVVYFPDLKSRLSSAVIDNPRFIAPVATLVKAESRKVVDEQTKVEVRGNHLIESGTKLDNCSVFLPSVESKQPLTNISDDERTIAGAYSMETFSSGSYQYISVPPRAPLPTKNRRYN